VFTHPSTLLNFNTRRLFSGSVIPFLSLLFNVLCVQAEAAELWYDRVWSRAHKAPKSAQRAALTCDEELWHESFNMPIKITVKIAKKENDLGT
jgi:hypothetical protein